MKNKTTLSLFVAILFSALVILFPMKGRAGLPAPPLPPLVVPAPPPVVLIPGTYVYFPPDVDGDLLFYQGYWYRPFGGRWYRAYHYNGPWGFISMGRVPRVLINLPPGYRNAPPGHQRIPHGQLKKNWRTWEREKHWDRPAKRGRHEGRVMGEHESSPRGHGGGHGKGHGD
jgi:hypothetical protein